MWLAKESQSGAEVLQPKAFLTQERKRQPCHLVCLGGVSTELIAAVIVAVAGGGESSKKHMSISFHMLWLLWSFRKNEQLWT